MDIDAKDIVIGLVGVSLVVQTILGVTLASAITKIALTKLIETAVVKLLTGSGAAAATTGAAASSGTAVSVFSSAAPLLLNIAAVTLGIAAAATIGWQFGKTFGEFLATWLSNEGLISKESADEYSAIMDQPISAKFKDIKLSIQEGTFADAWTNMWGDWFDPVFAEVENLPITVLNWSIAVNDKVVGFGKAWTDFWADWFEPAFAEELIHLVHQLLIKVIWILRRQVLNGW